MRYYLSIEESTEAFELYRVPWNKFGLDGIRVGSMADGIEKAIEIEKGLSNEAPNKKREEARAKSRFFV